MLTELIILVLAILAAIVIYKILKKLVFLIWNSVIALIALWLLNILGLNIAINIWSVLIVAIGGFAGLILVVLLHVLKWAF